MTTLGLLSDSHGRAETTQAAVDQLLEHGADVLIHLGDVGGVEVIDALASPHPVSGAQVEAHLVFGNTDWDAAALAQYANDLGIAVHDPAGVIEVDGQSIGFTHGHIASAMQELLQRRLDYLLHGHTHRLADYQEGKTRVINPGALFRAGRYTAAVLSPETGRLEVLEVSGVKW